MMKRTRASLVQVVAVMFALGGCGTDDPMGNGDPPPDLSGTYDLVTLTSALLTMGIPVGPAQGVTGTFTLTQTDSSDDEASGTLNVNLTIPDGMGGFQQIPDVGTFTINSDGTWGQTGVQGQATGTWSLVGSTLTVEVTSPAQAVSTSVWQRR